MPRMRNGMIYSSIACNLDAHILMASLPLFEQEKVDAIEWSFDTLFKFNEIPSWFSDLIGEFSKNDRLVGHGVYFSLFSGKWLPEQQQWLDKLKKLSDQFHFDHISEHFGFLTGADFHKGAPIGIPLTTSTLAIGSDRLKRIQDACRCPVGLENLAFSYSLEEVKKHGDFLNQLVESVNGFIILDLHNLYCQSHNFSIPFNEIIRLYPLDRVREIHISGGSWDDLSNTHGKIVRRDTHDESVPEQVFDYLKRTVPKCANLKYVVLEQLGTALDSESRRVAFQNDFLRMDGIVKKESSAHINSITNNFLPAIGVIPDKVPPEDLPLYNQQTELSYILENARDLTDARMRLESSALSNSEWNVEQWEPAMLDTAIAIAQKWKNGF
ncbi:DUF692 family multinuclear iron-containing protein [Dyadobacter sp. CY323]|uniref:multinuclear nonheme iron-dependent oxidase n=1 Tax=Dyadobacter sp. CY323 TaxID=2907302 RepID=UPI001F41F656|nr:DUF692 family multinuclear iron-containing protein [Dyadobacter sp. CY323]MCE6992292.1 DUF692 domain-containing protein [Dyadobacter sp. CY323]